MLVKFVRQEHHRGDLVVKVDRFEAARVEPACEVSAMAADYRWNNLEDIRRAKSVIGNALLYGGAATAMMGGRGRRCS